MGIDDRHDAGSAQSRPKREVRSGYGRRPSRRGATAAGEFQVAYRGCMVVAIGMVCDKDGFGYTVVSRAARAETDQLDEEAEVEVPASKRTRGEELEFALEEAEAIFLRFAPSVVYMKPAGTGRFSADPGRYEVEGTVQLAAHRAGVRLEMRTTQQISADNGLGRKSADYDSLLARPDVAARSNRAKRERYLYATTALREVAGG